MTKRKKRSDQPTKSPPTPEATQSLLQYLDSWKGVIPNVTKENHKPKHKSKN